MPIASSPAQREEGVKVENMGVRDAGRPTVGKMMARDVFSYSTLVAPVMVVMIMFMGASEEPTDGSEYPDMPLLYALLVLFVAVDIGIIFWRWSMYSAVLNSGAEVPGEVTSVTKAGDSVVVEYTYRWQAETIKSTRKIGGYIQKRRIKEEVGLKAALLVDPAKPQRFLVLDTLR